MTTAVVLAGGMGTRLRSVVANVPKPMAPVRGRPFLEYQLDHWILQGIERFVLCVGFKHDLIEAHFGNSYKSAEIVYSVEAAPLDTGGALLLAADRTALSSPFLLLNGDTYFPVPFAKLEAFAMTNRADWCLSLFRSTESGRYMGVDVSPAGRILALEPRDSGGGSDPIGAPANGGVYWVHPRALADLPFSIGEKVSLEKGIFPAALGAGQRMFGLEFSETFLDIGLPSDYYIASDILGT